MNYKIENECGGLKVVKEKKELQAILILLFSLDWLVTKGQANHMVTNLSILVGEYHVHILLKVTFVCFCTSKQLQPISKSLTCKME